ncbi:hypothetical protein E1301_Tti019073 [Triplophysa tibetana]|uniref:HECT domain-containing protein n=1 Tax=Triplophysa tibetana TaxID=1572043 RepID=A0A5A9NU11_9TELE|nr:hypothetical protein E1301_Tti019073 [Triplophysa tibetana]
MKFNCRQAEEVKVFSVPKNLNEDGFKDFLRAIYPQLKNRNFDLCKVNRHRVVVPLDHCTPQSIRSSGVLGSSALYIRPEHEIYTDCDSEVTLAVIEIVSEAVEDLDDIQVDAEEEDVNAAVIEIVSEAVEDLDDIQVDAEEEDVTAAVIEIASEGTELLDFTAPAPYVSPQVEREHFDLMSAQDFTVDSPSANSDDENVQLASPVREFRKNIPDLSKFDTEAIPDPDVRDKLTKLQKCMGDADFSNIKADLGDWIAECGVPSIFSATLQDMPSVFAQVVTHYIYHRDLFTIKWSVEGSNKRDQEEDRIFQWECLLMSIQEGEAKDITFEELLAFVTGADALPPLGFPQKCSIEFYDQEEGSTLCPGFSPCLPEDSITHGPPRSRICFVSAIPTPVNSPLTTHELYILYLCVLSV